MNGNPYSRLLNTIKQQGEKNNGQVMSVGSVASIEPLSIKYNQVIVTNGVYCKFPQMPKTVLEAIEKDTNLTSEVKDFLKCIYESFNLQIEDKVIVQKVGNNLYILGKA